MRRRLPRPGCGCGRSIDQLDNGDRVREVTHQPTALFVAAGEKTGQSQGSAGGKRVLIRGKAKQNKLSADEPRGHANGEFLGRAFHSELTDEIWLARTERGLRKKTWRKSAQKPVEFSSHSTQRPFFFQSQKKRKKGKRKEKRKFFPAADGGVFAGKRRGQRGGFSVGIFFLAWTPTVGLGRTPWGFFRRMPLQCAGGGRIPPPLSSQE